MKSWRKVLALLLALALVVGMTACSGGGESSTSTPESSTSETSEPADESSEAEESESSEEAEETEETTTTGSYPREESLYQGGQQWSTPVSNNPMAANAVYAAMANGDTGARELVWETLYMYNISDSKDYPLLADGDWVWADDNSTVTVKLKAAAHWSDGSDLTAADVEASWDAYVNYDTNLGIAYEPYITDIVAVDDDTVEFQVNTGDGMNLMKVEELIRKMYIMQKAYLEELDTANGSDATAMKNEAMWDAPSTAPYHPLEQNDQKWVIQRDDNYWGQDESMWGKLPVPKYIIHNIYSSNDVGAQAFMNDFNQCYDYDGFKVDISEIKSSYESGETATFTVTVSPEGEYEYLWDFGDGKDPVPTKIPRIAYEMIASGDGESRVLTVTVTNADGDHITVTKTYFVGTESTVDPPEPEEPTDPDNPGETVDQDDGLGDIGQLISDNLYILIPLIVIILGAIAAVGRSGKKRSSKKRK